MMDSGEMNRQRISALVDGELDAAEARDLLGRMHDSEARTTWNAYHRIGDIIRNDAMARDLSRDFSARMAERLAAEPALLAPKRRLLSRFSGWPVTLAAIAATGFGFFVAPTLFNAKDSPLPAQPATAAVSVPVSHGTLLADAGSVAALSAEPAAYIRLHQASHPGMYGAIPGADGDVANRTREH